ncbi:MAG: primosomal protein N' [Chloroflexota bacterium]
MTTYVEIAVNVPGIISLYHYHLPPDMENRIHPGHLVIVPFGKQIVQGVVLRTVTQPAVPDTRSVQEILDPQPVLTHTQLELASHIAETTLAPLAACINLMLPPGLSQIADTVYAVNKDQTTDFLPAKGTQTDTQGRLLELLQQRGALRGRQIDRALPRRNWRPIAQMLIRRGVLVSHSLLPSPNVRPKRVRTAQLTCSPQEATEALPTLGKKDSQVLLRRQKMLHHLIQESEPINVSWLYAESGGSLADLRVLEKKGLALLSESEVWRDPLEGLSYIPIAPPTLTSDQKAVWKEIQAGIQAAHKGQRVAPLLLHGVTGSGKTEIYLQAVAHTLELGRRAIILVPEIALTPQTTRRFLSRFPGKVGLIHSRLSSGERYDTWRRARTGDISLVIGPRSALFTPLPNIGLIVVDESHDDSYYQWDVPPHYHARETAITYAHLTKAVCLLGSATPDIVSKYQAEKGHWHSLHLPSRILAHRKTVEAQVERYSLTSRYHHLEAEVETTDLPPVEIIDMRMELKSGNRSILSRSLQTALAEVIDRKRQAILFLNRRGTETYIFCRQCGQALKCPRCDLPLTHHRSWASLVCHHCNYKRKMPSRCPQCGSNHIRQYGTGTERVENHIKNIFPHVRTIRWDRDTTRKKGAHEAILSHFANHHADVLIGTQMLAKGLDLPLVTLVGVVLADVGLNLPDYRAAERTFQVLTQVAGRAGRSPLGGVVIMQTYEPDHYVIQAVARHDYASFYQQEMDYRSQLGYPPFTRLVRLEFRHADPTQAEESARALARNLQNWIPREDRRATTLIGPAPCFYSRIGGMYRWQIILRGPDPVSLLKNRPLGDWHIHVNPTSLL